MDLERYGKIVLFNIPSAVEFLVCRGVVSCGRPIYYDVLLIPILSFALRYMATILASATDDIILWMMVATTLTAPLLIIG